MTETVVHYVRPGGLPPVFTMHEYLVPPGAACQFGTSRKVSKKSQATHDPTLVTCQNCLDAFEAYETRFSD
jgi:hypothetical protein